MPRGDLPITFICAENHKMYRRWCSDNRTDLDNPQIVLVLSEENASKFGRGRRWLDGDRRIILGRPLPHILRLFDAVLAAMGCPDV
jgi:hypothetical protein